MEPYDSEQMARDFLIQFSNQIFTVGQQLAFSFQEKKVLSLIVKNLEGNLALGLKLKRILFHHRFSAPSIVLSFLFICPIFYFLYTQMVFYQEMDPGLLWRIKIQLIFRYYIIWLDIYNTENWTMDSHSN